MDLYRGSRTSQMDYNPEGRGPKAGKALPNNDERLDSGLDSLKEEEYIEVAADLRRLRLQCAPQCPPEQEGAEWKREVTEDGDTYLHLAVIHEAQDMAIKMIDMSINDPFLNQQNYQRQTALHLAVVTEQPQVVERLLKAGSDPTLVDNNGNTALHVACRTGSLTCFSLLTQNCPDQLPAILQTPNYSGQKCLHLVALHGYLSLVESLISLGADIDAQEQCNGRTALHLAVDLQNPELVKLLVSKGADANSLTYGGHTAYHLTYGRQNEEIQKVLYDLTSRNLRELPDSESEDSEDDYEQDYEEDSMSDDEMYDDIKVMGQK
ncbi:nuclear factor of kappa light polypeptide gene enhancer in B-cells inhibitor, alpha b [Salminus brasiliensis]|uniref:nuclear factor of kappa light polypeptide gene enhancer in B-cells inhibitor, alpha b n=1 Tax=Salminus brasiliensis TaxID=930266 RepID=UPI003B82EAD7